MKVFVITTSRSFEGPENMWLRSTLGQAFSIVPPEYRDGDDTPRAGPFRSGESWYRIAEASIDGDSFAP